MLEKKLIYGIQQIGVGVENADEAFEWYATRLGSDLSIFDDSNEATHMAPYMGGKPRNKRAILAFSIQGGSGFEIWQYLDRKPKAPVDQLALGDLGINISLVKSRDIEKSYRRLKSLDVNILDNISEGPDKKRVFHITDPYGNIIRIKEYSSWYRKKGFDLGGAFGCVIGVSDIDLALKLYSDVLGYDHIKYDETGQFDDLSGLQEGNGQFRRVLLHHREPRSGGFSPLLGSSQIELVQSLDREPKKIFRDRYWGDLGYIHVCFDIRHMESMVNECKEAGFPFTVLSEPNFDMGDTNAHWGYLEDPDGTLVEFVEAHKVPIIKKLNININLKKRKPTKPLPNWMIRSLVMKRVKF